MLTVRRKSEAHQSSAHAIRNLHQKKIASGHRLWLNPSQAGYSGDQYVHASDPAAENV